MIPGLLSGLTEVALELEGAGLYWAVIGELALRLRGLDREPHDIDIVVPIEGNLDVWPPIDSLKEAGWKAEKPTGAQQTVHKGAIRVDLFFSLHGLEGDICRTADRISIEPEISIPVARLGYLLVFAFLLEDDPKRASSSNREAIQNLLSEDDHQLALDTAERLEGSDRYRGRALCMELRKWLAE